jgi:septum formation protein
MKFKQHKKIILASGSPRRKEYLERYHFDFRVITSDIGEAVKEGESPIDYALRMSVEKAEAVAEFCSNDEIILAADTVVVLHDRIMGKPADVSDAIGMLEELNGNTHEVVTAYTIYIPEEVQTITNYVTTKVRFHRVASDLIKSYVETGEPMDKAGSYSIQSTGTFLVDSIEGSYNNVVGLPVEKVISDLLEYRFLSPH